MWSAPPTCYSEVKYTYYLTQVSYTYNTELTHPPLPSFPFPSRHALPLFTSLLNVVCAYDPVGYGIPYNHLLFSDYREQLVEQAIQILIVTLEHEAGSAASVALQALDASSASTSAMEEQEVVRGRIYTSCWV